VPESDDRRLRLKPRGGAGLIAWEPVEGGDDFAPVSPGTPLEEAEFVAVDIETTGNRPFLVLEIGAERFRLSGSLGLFDTLVQTRAPINPYAKRRHLIARGCQIENRRSYLDSNLPFELATLDLETGGDGVLLTQTALAAKSIEYRHRQLNTPVVRVQEMRRSRTDGAVVSKRRQSGKTLGADCPHVLSSLVERQLRCKQVGSLAKCQRNRSGLGHNCVAHRHGVERRSEGYRRIERCTERAHELETRTRLLATSGNELGVDSCKL